MDEKDMQQAPRWLLAATVVFTLVILFMAVAETTLWTHFLVDRGEYASIAGLAFIFVAGLWLYSNQRLKASLPLFIPWLIYPVLTQGDEIIDNLTINQMRLVSHVILAVLFAAPILMIVLSAKRLAPAPGSTPLVRGWTALIPGLRLIERNRIRSGVLLLVLSLLLAEVWIAVTFLGDLMVLTLLLMGLAYLYVESAAEGLLFRGRFTEKAALVVMLAGVVGSLGTFIGFKNRPGVYQGSPAAYLDPSQQDARYDFDRIPAGVSVESEGPPADEIRSILADYARALLSLNHAHYVMDRNYNYMFHNSLFLRHTPILPGFREKSLEEIESARISAQSADGRVSRLIAPLNDNEAVRRLLQDVQEFTAYNLRRCAVLDKMSAEFIKTEAGQQHATHLYEGEGKLLDVQLSALIGKHSAVVDRLGDSAKPLVEAGVQIHATYGNRIVGF